MGENDKNNNRMVTSPIEQGLQIMDTDTLPTSTTGTKPIDTSASGYPSVISILPSTTTVPVLSSSSIHAVLPFSSSINSTNPSLLPSSLSPLQMVATSLEQLVTTNDHQAVLRHSIDMLAKDSFHRHWNPQYLSAENKIHHPDILTPIPSNIMTALGYKQEGTIVSDWDVDVGALDTRLGLSELSLYELILSNNSGVNKSVLHYNVKVPEPLPTMEQLSWIMKIDPELSADILQLLMDMSSPDLALQDNILLIERFRKLLIRRDRRALLRKQRTEEIFATFAAVEAMIIATTSFDTKACERYLSNCRAAASGGVSDDGTSNIIMMDIYSGKITFGSFPWDQPLISSSNMNNATFMNTNTGSNISTSNTMVNSILSGTINNSASTSVFELAAPVYSRSTVPPASSTISSSSSASAMQDSRSNSPKPSKDTTAAPHPVKESPIHDLTQVVGNYEDYVLVYLPVTYNVATSIMQEYNISTANRTNNKDLWSNTFHDSIDGKLNMADIIVDSVSNNLPPGSSKKCGLLLEPATVPFPALRSVVSDATATRPSDNVTEEEEMKLSCSTVPPLSNSASIAPQYFPAEHPCAGLPIPSVTREIANANIIHGVSYIHTGRRPGELVQILPNDASVVQPNLSTLSPSPSITVTGPRSHPENPITKTTDDVLLSDRIPGLRITGLMENSVISKYGLLRTHDIVIGLGTSSPSAGSIQQVPVLWGTNGSSKEKALPMQPSPYITTESLAEWNPFSFAKAIEKANLFIVARPRQLVLLEAVIRNLPPVVSIYTPWVIKHNDALDEKYLAKNTSSIGMKTDANNNNNYPKNAPRSSASGTADTDNDTDPITLRLMGASVYETDSGIRMGSEESSFIQAMSPDGNFLAYQPTGNKHSDEELYQWDQNRGQEDVLYSNHSRHHSYNTHDQNNDAVNARNRNPGGGGGGGGGGIKKRRTVNPVTVAVTSTTHEETIVPTSALVNSTEDSSVKPSTEGMEIEGHTDSKPAPLSIASITSTTVETTTTTTTLTSDKKPKTKSKEAASKSVHTSSSSYYVPLPPLLPMKRSIWNVFLGMLRSEWVRSRVQRGKGSVPATSALGIRSNTLDPKLDSDLHSDNGSIRSRGSSIDSTDTNGANLDSNPPDENEKLDDILPLDSTVTTGDSSNVTSSGAKPGGSSMRVHLRSLPAICMKRALWSIGIDTSGDKLAIMHRIRVMLETPIVEDDDTTPVEESKPNEPERLLAHIASERMLKAMNIIQRQTLTNSRWWSIILPPVIGESEEQAMSRSLPLPIDLQIPIEESSPVSNVLSSPTFGAINDLTMDSKETEGTLAVEKNGRIGRIRKPSSRLLAAVAGESNTEITVVASVTSGETGTPKLLRSRGKRKRSNDAEAMDKTDTVHNDSENMENKSVVTRDEDTNSQAQGPASDVRSRDDDSVVGKGSVTIDTNNTDNHSIDTNGIDVKTEGIETVAHRKTSVDKDTTVPKPKGQIKPPLPKKSKGSTVATNKQKGNKSIVPMSTPTTNTSTGILPSQSPLTLHTPSLSLTIDEEALLEPLPDLLLNDDTPIELDASISTTLITGNSLSTLPISQPYPNTSKKAGKNNTKNTSTRTTGPVSRSSGSSSTINMSGNLTMGVTENLHPVHAAINMYSNLSIDECPHVRYTVVSQRADCLERERDLPGSGSSSIVPGSGVTNEGTIDRATIGSNNLSMGKVDIRSIDMITAVLGSVTAAQIDNSTYIISGSIPDAPSTVCRALLDLRLLHTSVTEPITVRPLYPLALGTAQGTGLLYEYNRFQSSGSTGTSTGNSSSASSNLNLSLMFEGSSNMNEMIIPPDFQRTPAQLLQYIAKIITPELRRFIPQNNDGSRLLIQQAHTIRYLLTNCNSSMAPNLSPVNSAVRWISYGSLASMDTPKTSGGGGGGGPLPTTVPSTATNASVTVNTTGTIPSLLPSVPGGRVTKQTSQLAAAAAAVAASLRKGPPVPLFGTGYADDTISEIESMDTTLTSNLSTKERYNRTFIQRIMYTDIGKLAHVNPVLTAYLSSTAPFAKETLPSSTEVTSRSPAETAIYLVNGGYRIVSAVEITRRMMNRAEHYFSVSSSHLEELVRSCVHTDQLNIPSLRNPSNNSPNLLMDMSGLASGVWLGTNSTAILTSQPPMLSPLRLSVPNVLSPSHSLGTANNNYLPSMSSTKTHPSSSETDDITMELLSTNNDHDMVSLDTHTTLLGGRRSMDNTPSPNNDIPSLSGGTNILVSRTKLPSILFFPSSFTNLLFNQPARIAMPMDRSTQSLNQLLALVVPLASEKGPQTAASFIRHILTIHEGVIAESARRRAGALVVEAVSRGLGNLAQIICSWVPAGMTPLEGDTLLIGSTVSSGENDNKYPLRSTVNSMNNSIGKSSSVPLSTLSPSRGGSAFSLRATTTAMETEDTGTNTMEGLTPPLNIASSHGSSSDVSVDTTAVTKLPLRRFRTSPTVFRKRWVPLPEWTWSFPVKDTLEGSSAFAALTSDTLPFPRYTVDIRQGLSGLSSNSNGIVSSSLAFPSISGIVNMNDGNKRMDDTKTGPMTVMQGTEKQALQILLGNLQIYVVEGYITTALQQRLRHPAAVLQYLLLQAQLQTLKTENHSHL